MDRRAFVSVVGLLGISGCVRSVTPGNGNSSDGSKPQGDKRSTDSPIVTGEEPELGPGENTTLTVTTSDITGIHFSTIPDLEDIELEFADATISPPPDTVAESYPPQWWWSSQSSVTVDVPIAVANNTKPGEYTYAVTATAADNGGSTRPTNDGDSPVAATASETDLAESASAPPREAFTITVVER